MGSICLYVLIKKNRLVSDVRAAFREIDTDYDILAVVVSGSGRMFTAGLDCNYLTKKSLLYKILRYIFL